MKYMSIDPGGLCGYAIWDGKERIVFGEKKPFDLLDELKSCLADGMLDFVIFEGYALSGAKAKAMTGSKFETVQVIGVVKWLCRKYEIGWVEQTPAQKEFVDNERLKMLGLYDKGMQHCRDATRHGVYWQLFTGKIRGINECQKGS